MDSVENAAGSKLPSPRAPDPALRPLSKARASLLERLHDQPEPLSLPSLQALTGLHENTLREHLAALIERGLIRRHRAEPTGRGRPAWLYESTYQEPGGSGYAEHAVTLTSTIVGSSADPVRTAGAAGEAWGHRLARSRGAVPVLPKAARRAVVQLFDEMGFETRPTLHDSPDVRLTHCPLLEAAHRDLAVVCALHLGIVRGALEAYGADPEGTALFPFEEPGACHLVMPPLS